MPLASRFPQYHITFNATTEPVIKQRNYKPVSHEKPVNTLFPSICLKPTHHLVVPFLLLPLTTECRQLIADHVAFTDVEFG